jgi:hypothetical protein
VICIQSIRAPFPVRRENPDEQTYPPKRKTNSPVPASQSIGTRSPARRPTHILSVRARFPSVCMRGRKRFPGKTPSRARAPQVRGEEEQRKSLSLLSLSRIPPPSTAGRPLRAYVSGPDPVCHPNDVQHSPRPIWLRPWSYLGRIFRRQEWIPGDNTLTLGHEKPVQACL